MSQKIVRKNYSPNGGVDLKSNDIIRDTNYLTGGANMRYGNNFGFRKRYGFHKKISEDSQRLGPLFDYEFIDRFGVRHHELITFVDTPFRLVDGFFTLTNNSGSPATMSFYYSEIFSQFIFSLNHIAGTSNIIAGVGDFGDKKVSTLISNINSISNFTCVVNPDDSSPATTSFAACIEILADEIIPAGATRDIVFNWWEEINTSMGGTVWIYNQPTQNRYSLNKPVLLHDVMYIPTAPMAEVSTLTTEKRLCKYDGLTYYRAGLPSAPMAVPGGPINAKTAGDIVIDCRGSYVLGPNPKSTKAGYRLQLKCRDNAGNVITGRISVRSRPIAGTADNLHIGIYCIFDDKGVPQTYKDDPLKFGHRYRDCAIKDQGFYDHCGFTGLSGATNTLTISMNATLPHSIKKNDVVRFYDTIQKAFISRKVDLVSGNDVTISTESLDESEDQGGNISCYVGAIFSTMTCLIWKAYQNELDYTPLYFLDEIPVDIFHPIMSGYDTSHGDPATGFLLYFDSRDDEGLHEKAVLDFPQYTPGKAPEVNFLATYNGLLIGAGDRNNPRTVYFDDIDQIETFPLSTHSFESKGPCTGIGQSGPALGVFSENTVEVAYGDLAQFNFRVETLAENIGCVSPNSIAEIDEGIIAFLSKRGVYTLSGGRNLAPMGVWKDKKSSLLEPLFTNEYPKSIDGLPVSYPNFFGALSAVDNVRKLYYLHIPYPIDSTHSYKRNLGGPDSQTWCYDYGVGSWLPVWTGLDFALGMTMYNGNLWGTSRATAGSFKSSLFKQITNKGIYNYGDHTLPISASIRGNHESLDDPNSYKKFLRAAIAAFGRCDSSQWVLGVRSYPNYDYSTVMTDAQITGRVGEIARVKLLAGKANSLMLEFYNNNRYEDFLICGWELTVSPTYMRPNSAFRSDD